jgi:NAD(P)-dependent dehydrogenase (short-subunit alcohol dehydrogenase family)
MKPVADALPELDILVNSAGVGWVGGEFGTHEYEPEIFEKAVRMHLTGPYRTIEACQPKLSKSSLAGGGSVISIASMASFFGIEMVPGYGAAKAGVVQMTKTLAVAWARRGIRVNAVAPGIIKTPMHAVETHQALAGLHPIGRMGEIADIVNAILYLESAPFVTGETLHVDGGQSAGH